MTTPLRRFSASLFRKLHFPDPMILLVGCVLLAGIATHLVPAGSFDRQMVDGREVVVAGTFRTVEPRPLSFFGILVALPLGMIEAAEVVFLIFLVGGAFTVVDRTGALRGGISWLSRRFGSSEIWLIPIISLVFAAGGILENAQEEIIPVIPVLLLLMRRLGFQPLTAALVSVGPAMVGSALSPVNPFQAGIAQRVAELPLLSGGGYRTLLLALALTYWIGATMRWVSRTRIQPDLEAVSGEADLDRRHTAILGAVFVTFGVLVYGLLGLGWGFNEMSALFFLMGVVAGLVGGLGLEGTARAYSQGFRDMATAAILVGLARSIFVVLRDGAIVDTIVQALFAPIADLPVALATLGMAGAHVLIHFPVPSMSGHAVVTMPILVPLADLLGMSRQTAVLAYQVGAGLSDLIVPTNGSLLALLAAGGLSYEMWIRWVLPRYLTLIGFGGAALVVAVAIGF